MTLGTLAATYRHWILKWENTKTLGIYAAIFSLIIQYHFLSLSIFFLSPLVLFFSLPLSSGLPLSVFFISPLILFFSFPLFLSPLGYKISGLGFLKKERVSWIVTEFPRVFVDIAP